MRWGHRERARRSWLRAALLGLLHTPSFQGSETQTTFSDWKSPLRTSEMHDFCPRKRFGAQSRDSGAPAQEGPARARGLSRSSRTAREAERGLDRAITWGRAGSSRRGCGAPSAAGPAGSSAPWTLVGSARPARNDARQARRQGKARPARAQRASVLTPSMMPPSISTLSPSMAGSQWSRLSRRPPPYRWDPGWARRTARARRSSALGKRSEARRQVPVPVLGGGRAGAERSLLSAVRWRRCRCVRRRRVPPPGRSAAGGVGAFPPRWWAWPGEEFCPGSRPREAGERSDRSRHVYKRAALPRGARYKNHAMLICPSRGGLFQCTGNGRARRATRTPLPPRNAAVAPPAAFLRDPDRWRPPAAPRGRVSALRRRPRCSAHSRGPHRHPLARLVGCGPRGCARVGCSVGGVRAWGCLFPEEDGGRDHSEEQLQDRGAPGKGSGGPTGASSVRRRKRRAAPPPRCRPESPLLPTGWQRAVAPRCANTDRAGTDLPLQLRGPGSAPASFSPPGRVSSVTPELAVPLLPVSS